MKYIYYFLVILTILSSQNLKTSTDEKTGDPMLVGIAQRSDITVEHYGKWFDEEYSEYRGDEELITASKDFLEEIEIETFLGTWCEDSRREVPRLYKILDEMEFPAGEMDLIIVDRDKKSGHGLQDGKNIHHVPTIIFYKSGIETGRIIESPIESLEEDIFNILIGAGQDPNYHDWEPEEKN